MKSVVVLHMDRELSKKEQSLIRLASKYAQIAIQANDVDVATTCLINSCEKMADFAIIRAIAAMKKTGGDYDLPKM